MSGYDCRNTYVVSLRRNSGTGDTDVMSLERLFQNVGPAVVNDRFLAVMKYKIPLRMCGNFYSMPGDTAPCIIDDLSQTCLYL